MKNTHKGFAPVIIIAIVAVVALGGIWYGTSKKDVPKSDTIIASSTNETASTSTGNPTSVQAALAAGGSYMCTFAIKDVNAESSGTYYIHNKQIRGDFTSTNKMVSQSIKSHTIIDDKFSYTWTDLAPTMGFKVPIVAPAQNSSAPAQANLNLNGAAENYNCTPWNVEPAKFAIPASVKFSEMPSAR